MQPLEDYILISKIFFLVLIFYLGFLTSHLVFKAKKAEEERQYYFYSFSLFSVLYMACRILLLIDYDPSSSEMTDFYIFGSFFAVLGVVGLMFAVERYVYRKMKYIPTVCILIFASLILIIPEYNGMRLVTIWVVVGTIFAILIPFLYLKVGLQSTGVIRRNSFLIAFGILIFLLGNGMNTGFLTVRFPILLIFAPVTMLIGLLIFEFGLK
ncbi:MAG: hypothetical protein ACTSQI_08490 [Candidatus Helarchaeota archaeon]